MRLVREEPARPPKPRMELPIRPPTNIQDFSSDEEQDGADEDPEVDPDPSNLTDEDLKAVLLQHGFKAGPIVASTRAVYERKLRKLLESGGGEEQNGAEPAVAYSDNEEAANGEEAELERELHETAAILEDAEGRHSQQMESRSAPSGGSSEDESRSAVPQRRGQPSRLDEENKNRTVQQSEFYTPRDSSRQETKLPQESVEDILKDIYPNPKNTPHGIYATPRRPIKGAAKMPVQYSYPDTPVSPLTQQRREEEQRLVPMYVQIATFVFVVFILCFIYVNVEESSSAAALLEGLNPWSGADEALLNQAEV